MPNLSTTGSLGKQRARLVAAREEMDRTIAAMDTVMAYYAGFGGKRIIGRPPGVKNAVKKGDEKTGVKKSTLTKPFKPKKIKKKGFAKRKLTAEGEARRVAGYRAYQERMRKEREATTEAEGRYKGMRGTPRKPVRKAQSVAA